MNGIIWLLAYELMFVSAMASCIWLAKGIKRELSEFSYNANTALKLMSKTTALVLSSTLVLYSSGILTYAGTR